MNPPINEFQLAYAFSKEMRYSITKHQLHKAIILNREEVDSDVCHTHDFCDANMVMDAALNRLGITEFDVSDEESCNLWNKAWDIAKAQEFGVQL